MIKLTSLLKEDYGGDTYNIGSKKYNTEKPKLSQNETEKKKGVDGAACWKGYRYAGTKDGKDICVECGGMMYEDMCMECNWDNEDQDTSYDGGYEHSEESIDHEVGMAQNLLKDIISNASQLMDKIGQDEINLPGWIQDHISQAQNFINQANTGYHEL